MIRFIHTADIHFGMENYGRIDPTTGIHSRLLDFNNSLNSCIDYAIDHDVDFFLFSGDAYKTATPSPTQQRLLIQSFLRLYDAHIPVIIIVGNHDHPVSYGKAHSLDIFKQFPVDGFHVFAQPNVITLNTKHGKKINIVGVPWPSRGTMALSTDHISDSHLDISHYLSQRVTQIISYFAQNLDPDIPAVLAGHLTVASGIFSGSEKRAIYGNDPFFLVSQLAIKPFDYIALGHLHRYQNLNPKGYPAVVYSGSIDRVDFGERKEKKGFCDVIIDAKGQTRHEFIELNTRPFIQIDVYLVIDQPQTEQILSEVSKFNLKESIVKIVYHLPVGSKDVVDIRVVQRACSSAHFIVAIIPVHALVARERRLELKVSMDLPTLLSRYFDTKKELAAKKDILINKALELEQEANDAEILSDE